MIEQRCPGDEDLLPLAVGDAIDEQLQQHVADCKSCQNRISQLMAEMATLRKLGYSREREETPDLSFDTTNSLRNEKQPSVPDRIGRYHIVKKLGEGGQAVVYRAVDPNLGHEVVIKLSKKNLMSDQADRSRIVQEGRVLAELDHPNLARVLDLGFDQDRPYLVLKFVRGLSLSQYAKSRSISAFAMAVLLGKVAEALAAAHERGVTHQDIKPDNIVIDESGEPQLIDFGMAVLRSCWLDAPDDDKVIAGTPAYMAPEQARGEIENVGPQSDIFALGAVLYRFLANKKPYAGTTVYETLERARTCDFDRAAVQNSDSPKQLQDTCLKAMARDPRQRHASARQLAEELRQVAQIRTRQRWSWAAISTLSLLLLAAILFAVVTGDGKTPPDGASVAPQVSIRIDQGGVMRDLTDSNALPVRNGSRVYFTGTVPKAFRHYEIFLFTPDGILQALTEYSESQSGEDRIEIKYPRDLVQAPFEGAAGTAVLLFCARKDRPIDLAELQSVFEDGGSWPADTFKHSTVEFDNRGARVPHSRSIHHQDSPERDVLLRAEEIRRKLDDQVDFYYGVAFPRSP